MSDQDRESSVIARSEVNASLASSALLQRDSVQSLGPPPLGAPTGPTQSQVYQGVNIWIVWVGASFHQVLARITGGNLGAPNYFQRTIVHQLNGPPPGGAGLPGVQIDLFGGSWATPTDWHAYEPKRTEHSYYFGGQHHQDGGWRWDAGVLVEKTPYTNGWLWRVSYEDGHDARYNDHILEIALVWVHSFDAEAAVIGEPAHYVDEVAP